MVSRGAALRGLGVLDGATQAMGPEVPDGLARPSRQVSWTHVPTFALEAQGPPHGQTEEAIGVRFVSAVVAAILPLKVVSRQVDARVFVVSRRADGSPPGQCARAVEGDVVEPGLPRLPGSFTLPPRKNPNQERTPHHSFPIPLPDVSRGTRHACSRAYSTHPPTPNERNSMSNTPTPTLTVSDLQALVDGIPNHARVRLVA